MGGDNVSQDQTSIICIDLKSFYASVECVERGLDPFKANLVVADPTRSKSTICLAITPAMKSLGIKNRCRIHEIPDCVKYITAMPRMQLYMDYSAKIYGIYLRYVSKEDIHVYSVDECFIDVTNYLQLYHLTAKEMAVKLMQEVIEETGITATAGVGTNLYLAKIAMDIVAKHVDDHIGILDEFSYREQLWDHKPLSDFWRIGSRTEKKLADYGIHTMGDIAMASLRSEDWLYKMFGIDAELLIDHAWGYETCRMSDIKNYHSEEHSLSNGQVLMRNYSFDEALVIVREMTDNLVLDLFEKGLVLNALSNNMIMVDRKKLKNPNGLILGTPGSGKSFAAKREITNAFFVTKDDIIIGDPEGEYYPLVHALGGQVVHISPTSKDYINPMDINMDYSDDDNPLGVKSDFVLSLCELIMGSRDGIEAEEKSVIDRCLPLVYQKYFADPKPENMPVLGDLYDCLRKQKEPQAQRIATALEIYVNGSLKVFNHRTNVELNNRIVCFDIKELGKQLKKIGMLIVQDQVWNRVTINRGIKSTRYYIDEFHLLLKEEQTAAYSVEIWKRFRKWGGIPSGITQNIKDLLASREIENIFENSDFILMLNQAAGDRQILAKQLNISPYQLSYVTNSGEGEGLLFYGTTIIPFKDKFDKNLKLYSLMTTKPEEVEKREKEMEAEKHEGNR